MTTTLVALFLAVSVAWVQGQTNAARKVPPSGIVIAAGDREQLGIGVEELGKEIEELRQTLKTKPALLELLPDVQIYHKAVRWPLVYDEFLRSNDVALARGLLRLGGERARALREGRAPWLSATGLVVRGYVSTIDGSVQPYGLVVPATYEPGAPRQHRLDVWLHGRDNQLTELKFISDRQRSPGEFTPADTIVLHPYGRYCNAFKFAGETDVFEALEHARRSYAIDGNRIAVRGFSMGGAGCWHLAAHHAGSWAAAAPGAGFVEVAEYTGILNRGPKPPWFQQKLWHLYNATDYAVNLFNCPTMAYSGEWDKQKQAADMMARAMAAEGLELTHLIGPKTEHRYEPQTKSELARRFDEAMARGRNPVPAKVRFTTWTLRYNRMFWVTVEGLERHWERARVDAEIANPHLLEVKTENVNALTFSMPEGLCPLDTGLRPQLRMDGVKLDAPLVFSNRSWKVRLLKQGGRWSVVHTLEDGALRKRPGLQGPIDDAFLERFVVVRPTGHPKDGTVGAWVAMEMAQATNHWRAQFRGDVVVKDDVDVTDADTAGSHLVLWGDPQSNRLLARMADRLPLRWEGENIRISDRTFPAAGHVPVMIYPNPLNPKRYVVVNSGITFADVGHLSNALQTPKLPDFAVIEMGQPPRVVHADFFDERWQVPKWRGEAR